MTREDHVPTVVAVGLRQLPDEGLRRLAESEGPMLLTGAVLNRLSGHG